MDIVKTADELKKQIKAWKAEGYSIGYVPTMGYLHEGHQSLIACSVSENDKTVVSVFVNPIQFGPNEDFATYPRDLEKDAELCEITGADLIFHPDASDMYSDMFSSYVDVNGLTDNLCGSKRPGHFRGVCTVLTKFFHLISPDRAYFGEKDAQQLAVVRRMVEDLNFPLEIKGCPIIREADGLAKSSRNTYLSPEERKAALVLSRSLFAAKSAMERGERSADIITGIIRSEIEQEPLAQIDYVQMVDSLTMKDVEKAERDVLVAIAVYIGKTRLIDNFTYHI